MQFWPQQLHFQISPFIHRGTPSTLKMTEFRSTWPDPCCLQSHFQLDFWINRLLLPQFFYLCIVLLLSFLLNQLLLFFKRQTNALTTCLSSWRTLCLSLLENVFPVIESWFFFYLFNYSVFSLRSRTVFLIYEFQDPIQSLPHSQCSKMVY